MNSMYAIIVVVQVLSALLIVGLVLLQHGKGADMGAAFGSGASGSLFGATGSSSFLTKSTAIAATVFFASTLALTSMGADRHAASGAALLESPVTKTENKAANPASAPASTPASAPAAAAPVVPAVPAASAPAVAPASSAPAAAEGQNSK